jgi:hypothetical protein
MDVDSTYELLGAAHNYWFATFGRNGANNQGGTGVYPRAYPYEDAAYTLVDNLWDMDSYCPNAGYIPGWGFMIFCVGTPLITDCVGHEYTHSFTHYTANPAYTHESGALDEGAADFFGQASEYFRYGSTNWREDWLGGSVVRDLAHPELSAEGYGPHPDHKYSSIYYCSDGDHGGVHYNSTVPSHACCLMSEGGELNGCWIQPIGFDAVQRILYRGWTTYFVGTETFFEAYEDLQTACTDLYGATHPEYLSSVIAALQAAEMDQPGRCDTTAVERAPFCAVHAAGSVSCDSVAYGTIAVNGSGGLQGKTVTAYMTVHPAVDAVWEPLTTLASDGYWLPITTFGQATGTVQTDGDVLIQLDADTSGLFDLIVDENNDGFYQPWADTLLTVTVHPAVVSGLVAQVVDAAGIALFWRPLGGASQYAVECDSTLSFAAPWVAGTVADTSFVDSVNVGIRGRLFYRVRAVE